MPFIPVHPITKQHSSENILKFCDLILTLFQNKKGLCAVDVAIVNDIPQEIGTAVLSSESFIASQVGKNGFNSLHVAAKRGKTW